MKTEASMVASLTDSDLFLILNEQVESLGYKNVMCGWKSCSELTLDQGGVKSSDPTSTSLDNSDTFLWVFARRPYRKKRRFFGGSQI